MSRLTVPLAKIKRLWWGYQGSYVVELDDEKVQMDLRGFYNGLGLLLPSKGHEIKVRLPPPFSSSRIDIDLTD